MWHSTGAWAYSQAVSIPGLPLPSRVTWGTGLQPRGGLPPTPLLFPLNPVPFGLDVGEGEQGMPSPGPEGTKRLTLLQ